MGSWCGCVDFFCGKKQLLGFADLIVCRDLKVGPRLVVELFDPMWKYAQALFNILQNIICYLELVADLLIFSIVLKFFY